MRAKSLATDVSRPGFILLRHSFEAVAYNSEAVHILAFPRRPELLKDPHTFLRRTIRSKLVARARLGGFDFVTEFVSGNRSYTCTVLEMQGPDIDNAESQPTRALLLQRSASPWQVRRRTCNRYGLTPREQQLIGLLVQGLTSKEIAGLMHLSPNTVKTFLRLIMTKMNVSTRSAIVGKIMEASN